MAITFICVGLVLLIIGLIVGLKNIRTVYMNVISGIVIVIGTCFGLFGKQLQDLSSSEKSDKILKTGENTSDKIDILKSQNTELQLKGDSLNDRLEEQAQIIDKLRIENTDLYGKLSKSQQNILSNTERTLQPLSINGLSISLSYSLNNLKVKEVVANIFELKKQVEDMYSTAPPAVNGQRYLPETPGVIAFPNDDNKITTPISIDNEIFLSNSGFEIPNLVFQFSKKYPIEEKEKLKTGTYILKDFSDISLDFQSYQNIDPNKLQNIYIDFDNEKIIFNIQLARWHYKLDNGEIASFKDLFGKYLKVSAYYNAHDENQSKIEIVSVVLFNDKKRLQFVFNKTEKTKSQFDFNAAYIHIISPKDFLK